MAPPEICAQTQLPVQVETNALKQSLSRGADKNGKLAGHQGLSEIMG